jgi:hypothetical protein
MLGGALLLGLACGGTNGTDGGNPPPPAQVATLTGFTPTSGPAGITVTLSGTHFDESDAFGPRFAWSATGIRAAFQATNISLSLARFNSWTDDFIQVVIGDSITCGYGNEASDQYVSFSTDTENACLAYEFLTAQAVEYIQTGVVQSLTTAGDAKIHFIQFPVQDGSDGYGADWHPSAARHQKVANQLTADIKTVMGW